MSVSNDTVQEIKVKVKGRINDNIAKEAGLSATVFHRAETVMKRRIDILTQNDLIYCVGVQAASALYSIRKQSYSLNGVSRGSILRRYHPNKYLINIP